MGLEYFQRVVDVLVEEIEIEQVQEGYSPGEVDLSNGLRLVSIELKHNRNGMLIQRDNIVLDR